MQIIFKANDGTIFYSAEECVQYELEVMNKAKDWEGWNWDGKPTTKTFQAVVVKLSNEDAAEQFLAAADAEGDNNIKGIEVGDEGLFFYDEGSEQYVLVNDIIINIFKNILTS